MNARKSFDPAFLPSAGLNERRATLHVYSHSDLIRLKDGGTGLGHFYRCTETDKPRLWGVETTFAKDDGAN